MIQRPAGALKLLMAQTISSPVASVDFTSTLINSAFDEYLLNFENIVAGSGGQVLFWRTSLDGGATFDSTAGDYEQVYEYHNTAPGSGNFESATATRVVLAATVSGTASDGGASGWLHIITPSVAAYKTMRHFSEGFLSTGALQTLRGAGMRKTATAVNGGRLAFGAGNINSGNVKLYALRKQP